MKAILQDIPLGKRKTQIGLTLRQAWFLNGCFFATPVPGKNRAGEHTEKGIEGWGYSNTWIGRKKLNS